MNLLTEFEDGLSKLYWVWCSVEKFVLQCFAVCCSVL